ncbi:MAG: hypothetical protein LBQ15_07960 [Clostridium sp.]|jgi:hypothetical protein|nr:hypothetical protein [Clostridium sp.]
MRGKEKRKFSIQTGCLLILLLLVTGCQSPERSQVLMGNPDETGNPADDNAITSRPALPTGENLSLAGTNGRGESIEWNGRNLTLPLGDISMRYDDYVREEEAVPMEREAFTALVGILESLEWFGGSDEENTEFQNHHEAEKTMGRRAH